MMKKMIATLGLAVAASAGALVLTGSPASAQTTQAPARASVVHVQTSTVADRHFRDHRGHRGYYYYRHHHGNRHTYFYDHHIVFRDGR